MLIPVFVVSLSVIAFEILMTRVFAISQWHHLSFMVISVAMFGMAASGTYLGLMESRSGQPGPQSQQPSRIAFLGLCYVASAVGSFYGLNYLPLDYYKLPVQPIQALYVLIAYLSLAAPFFFAGWIISQAYMTRPEQSGLIYFASMGGSALGAVIPMVLIGPLGEGKLLVLMICLPLTICVVLPLQKRGQSAKPASRAFVTLNPLSWVGLILGCISLTVILGLRPDHPLFAIPISEYKELHQLLQYPNTRVIKSVNSITGRIDTVQSPYLRYSPGMSLQYEHGLPPQMALFKDGDNRLICYDPAAPDAFLFASYAIAYAGYLSAPENGKTLIIQNGGGSAIACALSAAQRQLTVIEKSPRFAEQINQHYDIAAISISPQIFLARTTDQFDIIHLENWGPSLPGTMALAVDPMFTIDAFKSYWAHLSENGVLVLTRKLILPPSNMIRIAANAYRALQAMQLSEPDKHIVILRNWDTFALLVLKKSRQTMDYITVFMTEMNFDLVWPRELHPDMVNQFNRFEKPFYADIIQSLFRAMSQGKQKSFFRQYPLDVRPQTADRPYPDKYFRWSRAGKIHQLTGSRLYSLLLSGEIIVFVVLLEAALIAILLLFGPVWIVGGLSHMPAFAAALLFTCLGAGFMLVELYFIYYFTMIYNHPVVSFSIVLGVVLVSSSLGGLISQRLTYRSCMWAAGAIAALLLSMLLWFNFLIEMTMHLPIIACLATASMLMVPVGILVGIPFPLAIRHLIESPAHRAFAWAINGSASVLAAIASTQIAITWGLTSLLGCAVVAYALAGIALVGFKDSRGQGAK